VMTERVSKNIQMRVLFGSDFFLGLCARSDKRVRGLDEKSGDRPFAVDLSAHSPVFSYRFSFFFFHVLFVFLANNSGSGRLVCGRSNYQKRKYAGDAIPYAVESGRNGGACIFHSFPSSSPGMDLSLTCMFSGKNK
jgi:hypothetical protein